MALRTFAVAALAAITGCASYANRTTARLVPVGETRIAIAVDAVVFPHGRNYFVLPAPEIIVRRGMTDEWDLGLRGGLANFEVHGTRSLIQSTGFALAIVPGAAFAFAAIAWLCLDRQLRRRGIKHS